MQNELWNKALRLSKTVIDEGDGWFLVEGKEEEKHHVYFVGSRVSCDCSYKALSGQHGDLICSHIIAVIIYLAFLPEE